MGLTEGDAGVLLANLVTVFVGEEHVSRETTLGRVGVCEWGQSRDTRIETDDIPFFLRVVGLVLRVVFSLGILMVGSCSSRLVRAL